MPSYNLAAEIMRTPDNDLIEAYKEQKDLYTDPGVAFNAKKMEEEYKAFRQAKEKALRRSSPWNAEDDENADESQVVQNYAQRECDHMSEYSDLPWNDTSELVQPDSEAFDGPISDQLHELLWNIIDGDAGYHPVGLHTNIESNPVNEFLPNKDMIYDKIIELVEVERIEEPVQNGKVIAKNESDTDTKHKAISNCGSPSLAETFSTRSQLNNEGIEISMGWFDGHGKNRPSNPLPINPGGIQASTTGEEFVDTHFDNRSTADREQRFGRDVDDFSRQKLLGENKATDEASRVVHGRAEIEEDKEAQEPFPGSGTHKVAVNNSQRQDSSSILQFGRVLVPQLRTSQIPHHHLPLAPRGPTVAGNVQTPRATVQGSKRGPKPYRPPPGMADVVEERLATSLQQLIPWLRANILPERAAQGQRKYKRSARPIVRFPDANDLESKMGQLEKLLDTNYARLFRSFVENIIDQERKKLGKPPAFQETAQKKMGDGNADYIDAAVRKLLRRRIRDAKIAGPTNQASGATGSSGQASPVHGIRAASLPSQKINNSGFPTNVIASADHLNMTAIVGLPPYPAIGRPSYISPFIGPNQAQNSENKRKPHAEDNHWGPSKRSRMR